MAEFTISETTKIIDVFNRFPFLEADLIELDSKFKRFKNPILRRTVGRKATLNDVSAIIGIDLNKLMDYILAKIEEKSQTIVSFEEDIQEIKSGWVDEKARKREMMKALVLELHEGQDDLSTLQERFREILGDVEATDIATMEQELINSGELTVDQITLLCDLHVGIFEESLREKLKPETKPGHPVHTYMAENAKAKEIIAELRRKPTPELIAELGKIEIHYTRLENQLFPMLEKKKFEGPSQVMWAKHDEVRALIRQRENVDVNELTSQVEDMIFKEESILFPTSMELLTSVDWQRVRNGEEEIGFAWVTPGDEWKPLTPEDIHQVPSTLISDKILSLDTGKMPLELLNLILTHLPIEISFINEQDEVVYYSDTKERIFPRSPGVIGRKVQKCHPPKSVHLVNQIIDAFKAGTQDVAEFWITMAGKFLHIRYFAIRDTDNIYRGTLEVMQDVTKIRSLEGERRLVHWGE